VFFGGQVSFSEIYSVLTFPPDKEFLLAALKQTIFLSSPFSSIVIVGKTEVKSFKIARQSIKLS
jgi:hypothetical protein